MFGGVGGIHYLCIDNVREMSGWGNNTSWSVDSNLLYKIIKVPTIKIKKKICLSQIFFLSLMYYECKCIGIYYCWVFNLRGGLYIDP